VRQKAKFKYIFITGGVISGVGKGITTSSLALLLKSKGFTVAPFKCDPYINVDAGTMNPVEHGEVFVTDDGAETDQDLGNYERFLDVDLSKSNFTTTGRVYLSVIQRERNLEYEGACVEVVPHIPLEIIAQINEAGSKLNADVVMIEVGGTVGEYQNLLFLEANRILKLKHPDDVIHIHVGYLPTPKSLGEMKSKPIQQSVRLLNAAGIQPDFIIGRSESKMDQKRRGKLALFCNVDEENIITNPDVASIYEVPLLLDEQKLAEKVCRSLRIRPKNKKKDLVLWKEFTRKARKPQGDIKIGLVAKYITTGDFSLEDSYVSVVEALRHAAFTQNLKPKLTWIDSQNLTQKGVEALSDFDGIIVPQGWGSRGVEGKIMAAGYARENNIPYFGLCFGMQMAVIEFARNVLGLKGANSTEADPATPHPVIHVMPDQAEYLAKKQYGGTIRLGAWPCVLDKDSIAARAYKTTKISERHRHRYEFNNAYRQRFEKAGMKIVGTTPDGKLVESIEITGHPFFIGTQFHPEYKSRPLSPHPLFMAFVKSIYKIKSGSGFAGMNLTI